MLTLLQSMRMFRLIRTSAERFELQGFIGCTRKLHRQTGRRIFPIFLLWKTEAHQRAVE
jgi:hypothetical protein